MTTEEMERRLNAVGYFLRDDRDIREGDEHFKGIEEAYSLYTVNPFERHHVWGWAAGLGYREVVQPHLQIDNASLRLLRLLRARCMRWR